MSEETFERIKPQINIGTIGHVDHGKTTLTAAIISVLAKTYGGQSRSFEEIHNAPEEKAQGVIINISRVGYTTPARNYAHVDCVGHADIVKTMIVGTALDGAILVVSATEGPMPQSREHILLARQVGVSSIIVFLNKCDWADDEGIELVELEVRELLSEFGFPGEDTPIIRGSALKALEGAAEWEAKIRELVEKLDNYIREPEPAIDVSSLEAHTTFKSAVYILSKEEGGRRTPFLRGYRPQFHFDTTDVIGSIELPLGAEMAIPGANITMIITLTHPVAMHEGQRFAIREDQRTVGVGVVSKVIA